MTSVHQSGKSLPLSPNSTGFVFLLLIQALALFFCWPSIKMLMFPGSSAKMTCLFWPSSPPAVSFLARLSSLIVVNTVLLSFLNKLLPWFPLSSHPIYKFLLVENSSQAPPGSSCFLLFPTHLHKTNSVSATPSMPPFLLCNLYSWYVTKEKHYLFHITDFNYHEVSWGQKGQTRVSQVIRSPSVLGLQHMISTREFRHWSVLVTWIHGCGKK